MLSRRLLLGLVEAGLLTTQGLRGSAVLAHPPEARNAKSDEALRGLVENRGTPGIAVLILQDGRPVYSRSVGAREPGGSAPIGAADMFRLASMTKAVTTVAAMILVEEGRLGLDDLISRHLPEFPDRRGRQADSTLAAATR